MRCRMMWTIALLGSLACGDDGPQDTAPTDESGAPATGDTTDDTAVTSSTGAMLTTADPIPRRTIRARHPPVLPATAARTRRCSRIRPTPRCRGRGPSVRARSRSLGSRSRSGIPPSSARKQRSTRSSTTSANSCPRASRPRSRTPTILGSRAIAGETYRSMPITARIPSSCSCTAPPASARSRCPR